MDVVGAVSLGASGIRLPANPVSSGVYAFRVTRNGKSFIAYVGESGKVGKRLAKYERPHRSNSTDVGVNLLITFFLQSGDDVELLMVRNPFLKLADRGKLGLNNLAARRLLEAAAVVGVEAQGVRVVANFPDDAPIPLPEAG